MEARRELLGAQLQLAVILLELFGVLYDSLGQPASFPSGDREVVAQRGTAAGSPCRDRSDLCVGDRLSGIDAEIDCAQQRCAGIAVRGALLVKDRSGREQHAQRSALTGLAWAGKCVVVAAQVS